MPPMRKSSAPPSTPDRTTTSNESFPPADYSSNVDEEEEENSIPNQKSLLAQIQRQRQLIQTKAKDKGMKDIAEEAR